MATATCKVPTDAWLRLKTACRQRGLKLYWVAAEAGMSYKTLWGRMNESPAHAPLTTADKHRLADVVGVSAVELFPELNDDLAP